MKAVERFDPVFQAQVPTYLSATGKRVGLPIHLNTRRVARDIQRFIL